MGFDWKHGYMLKYLRPAGLSRLLLHGHELPQRTRHNLITLCAGGSVFLFDRRAVRFFRKDGHSWRKKADGKTVRETHEKLKVLACR